jgi:hypothetical protein
MTLQPTLIFEWLITNVTNIWALPTMCATYLLIWKIYYMYHKHKDILYCVWSDVSSHDTIDRMICYTHHRNMDGPHHVCLDLVYSDIKETIMIVTKWKNKYKQYTRIKISSSMVTCITIVIYLPECNQCVTSHKNELFNIKRLQSNPNIVSLFTAICCGILRVPVNLNAYCNWQLVQKPPAGLRKDIIYSDSWKHFDSCHTLLISHHRSKVKQH